MTEVAPKPVALSALVLFSYCKAALDIQSWDSKTLIFSWLLVVIFLCND